MSGFTRLLILIPASIRKLLSIDKGDKLVAYTSGDVIMLKALKLPTIEEFEESMDEAQAWATDEIIDEYNEIIQEMISRKQGHLNKDILAPLIGTMEIVESRTEVKSFSPTDLKYMRYFLELYPLTGNCSYFKNELSADRNRPQFGDDLEMIFRIHRGSFPADSDCDPDCNPLQI